MDIYPFLTVTHHHQWHHRQCPLGSHDSKHAPIYCNGRSGAAALLQHRGNKTFHFAKLTKNKSRNWKSNRQLSHGWLLCEHVCLQSYETCSELRGKCANLVVNLVSKTLLYFYWRTDKAMIAKPRNHLQESRKEMLHHSTKKKSPDYCISLLKSDELGVLFNHLLTNQSLVWLSCSL